MQNLMNKLPDFYLELFEDRLNLDPSVLVKRPVFYNNFEELLNLWWKNKNISIALIGSQGTGKTTILNLLAKWVPQPQEVNLLCPKQRIKTEKDLWSFLAQGLSLETIPKSLQDAKDTILKGPKRIVFVDDVHFFRLRVMGGLEGVRHLILLMEATASHCLWATVFNKICWQKLDHLLNISRHFSHVWEIPYFSTETLCVILEQRHKKSGLSLKFSDNISEQKNKSESKTKDSFIQQLCKASSGSFPAAASVWLKSIQWDQKEKEIIMQPIDLPEPKLPTWFEPNNMCALAEILSHSYLTAQELSEIFLWDEDEAMAFLTPLLRLEILEVVNNEHYRINPLHLLMVQSSMSKAGLLPSLKI